MRDCQDNGNGICDCFIDLEHEMTERALRQSHVWGTPVQRRLK